MRGRFRSRDTYEGPGDDWLAEPGEFNWLDDPRDDEPGAPGELEGASRGEGRRRSGPAGERAPADPETIARRRRILALGALGLVIVAVIAVVVATSGGSSKPPAAV